MARLKAIDPDHLLAYNTLKSTNVTLSVQSSQRTITLQYTLQHSI